MRLRRRGSTSKYCTRLRTSKYVKTNKVESLFDSRRSFRSWCAAPPPWCPATWTWLPLWTSRARVCFAFSLAPPLCLLCRRSRREWNLQILVNRGHFWRSPVCKFFLSCSVGAFATAVYENYFNFFYHVAADFYHCWARSLFSDFSFLFDFNCCPWFCNDFDLTEKASICRRSLLIYWLLSKRLVYSYYEQRQNYSPRLFPSNDSPPVTDVCAISEIFELEFTFSESSGKEAQSKSRLLIKRLLLLDCTRKNFVHRVCLPLINHIRKWWAVFEIFTVQVSCNDERLKLFHH